MTRRSHGELRTLIFACMFLGTTCVSRVWAASNPPNCPKTGQAPALGEFRDLVPGNQCSGGLNNGANCTADSECPGGGRCSPGDTPITGLKIEGETIYYEATLSFNPTACGYEGGSMCIDLPPVGSCPGGNPPISPQRCVGGPNAGANCTAASTCPGGSCVVLFGSECCDVTPPGGIPLICSSPGCNPQGVDTVVSRQVAYVVHFADRSTQCTDPTNVRAVFNYFNGTSHHGPNDEFPVNSTQPICNSIVTPTPTPTVTVTPTPTDTPTPTPTDTPTSTPTATPTSTVTASATPTPTPTTSTSPSPMLLDHFQCYEAERGAFAKFPVTLTDRFGASTVTVVRPKRLCNPADKNGEDPTAPTHTDHLTGYIIKQTTPKFVRVRAQTVANQFGSVVLDLIRPDYLMVPSAKSLTGPPPPLVNPAVDHFKCYRVLKAKERASGLLITDQFGTLTEDVKQPFRLCIPADKNGSGIIDPNSTLMCYKSRTTSGTPPFRGPTDPVFIDNQFGPDSLIVNHLRELCVPSTLNP